MDSQDQSPLDRQKLEVPAFQANDPSIVGHFPELEPAIGQDCCCYCMQQHCSESERWHGQRKNVYGVGVAFADCFIRPSPLILILHIGALHPRFKCRRRCDGPSRPLMSSPPPRLIAIRSFGDLIQYINALLTDPRYFATLAALVILGDAVLTQLIIRFVPCKLVSSRSCGLLNVLCRHRDRLGNLHVSAGTVHEWRTRLWSYIWTHRPSRVSTHPGADADHCQQYSIYPSLATSSYPAGHLYVHRVLYALTDHGKNLAAAQQIFGLLYILSLALSCAIYHIAGGVPNWIVLLLPLSKRLHSIYVLRLFNDCWSVVAAQAAILAFASGSDTLGVLIYRCDDYTLFICIS